MHFPAYQQTIRQFVRTNQLQISARDRTLDLVAELGEIAKEILTATRYGRQNFSPTENWADELGDTFFALICLANSTGVNLDTALQDTLHKYQRRIEQKGQADSGR